MSRLEVLVTTMHQTGSEKFASMNLQTDAVLANQADRDEKFVEEINGHKVTMVTTKTRGTSKNRNIAIENSTDEYIMFSDDDLRFYDNYEELVLSEFESHPEAEAIKFNIRQVAGRKTIIKPITEFQKAKRSKITTYGVWGIAINRSVLEAHGLRFDEAFGPGTKNSCGEDTIFLQEMIKHHVKFYLSPKVIADIDQSVSSWFEGFDNEKYFVTTGKVIARIYPALSYILVIRSTVKCTLQKKSSLPFFTILKAYYKGVISQTLHHKG